MVGYLLTVFLSVDHHAGHVLSTKPRFNLAGLARKEDFAFVTYYCPHCNALNGSRQQEDGEMVTPTDRSFGKSFQASASLADSGVSSPVGRSLPTVEELPAESSGASNLTIAEQPRAESSSAAYNLPPTVEVPPADQLAC